MARLTQNANLIGEALRLIVERAMLAAQELFKVEVEL